MKIVVTMKVVPKSEEVKIDKETMTLDRAAVRNEINRPDKNAIEMALQMREAVGGEVVLMSMGPPMFEDFQKLGIAMGADDAILLSDRRFGGADTLPTTRVLAEGIQKLGDVDLVLCGEESADAATGQVPPGLAEWLDWTQITYATELRVLEDGRLAGKRELSGGHEWVAVPMPTVVSVCQGCNSPRFPDFRRKHWADENHDITVWSADDFDVDENELGLPGSPTRVDGVKEAPMPERLRELLRGTPQEVAARLAEHLKGHVAP